MAYVLNRVEKDHVICFSDSKTQKEPLAVKKSATQTDIEQNTNEGDCMDGKHGLITLFEKSIPHI